MESRKNLRLRGWEWDNHSVVRLSWGKPTKKATHIAGFKEHCEQVNSGLGSVKWLRSKALLIKGIKNSGYPLLGTHNAERAWS